MEDKRFMTLEEYQDEYWDEYIKGENIDILEFLKRKKQEALEAGNKELAEHIETIYEEAYEEERFNDEAYEEEKLTMQDDDEYYDGLEEAEEREREEEEEIEANDYDEAEEFLYQVRRDKKAIKQYYRQYKKLLSKIGESKKTIKEIKESLEDESLDESDREWYEDLIYRKELDIRNDTCEANIYKRDIELVNFETSLRSMTPEEIGETYSTLLETKGLYYEDKLILIEGYVQVEKNHEAQKLIQAQKEKYEKRKQTEKEQQESMEYEEALGNAPIGETTLDKMLHKTKTPEELEGMSEDELQQLIANNDQTIEENNTAIKKALVERVLAQQETIAEQQSEMNRLNSQKKEL